MLLVISFVVFMLLGLPLFGVIGLASIISMIGMPFPMEFIPQNLYTGMDQFPLIATIGFVMAGFLMEPAGITGEIIEVAKKAVGNIRGGLAMVTILACMIFAALSGSGPATTAAIGSIMIPGMIAAGYRKDDAAAVSATGGTLGILIPPSNPMLVYGIIANVSISALFTAGFVPGALVGTCLMFTAYTIARRHGYKGTMHSYTMAEFGRALLKNIWSLMAPVVILGGIYAGICTPVEASVVAVWYALFVGFFITKKLSLKEVFNAMKLANISTGTILIVVGVSTIFGRFLTMYQIPQQLAAQMMLYTTNPILILLLIAALLFFLGMFMETLATIVVLAPVFLPIIKSVGIDPVFFGVFWVITNEIALLTPPLGVNLFIAMNLSNLPLERVAKGACPYIFLLILVVFFLIFFPDVVTFLPKALGMY